MSGGRLVVLDRLGRAGKSFPLARGLATLGAADACDVRVLQPAVRPHHATIAVHAAQTIIRNEADGETLVNGRSVSVAALQHNDVIMVGSRCMRWEYSAPGKRHDASSGGKQVAIVQPQRRDTNEQIDKSPGWGQEQAARRAADTADADAAGRQAARRAADTANADAAGRQAARRAADTADADAAGRQAARRAADTADADAAERQAARASPVPADTTKATLWIESRKTSPRRRVASPAPAAARAARRSLGGGGEGGGGGGGGGVLRRAALRRAHCARRALVKISAPAHLDPTKQAAIMLMTKHTPKARLSAPAPAQRRSPAAGGDHITPKRASTYANRSGRTSGRQAVTTLEISDNSVSRSHSAGRPRSSGRPQSAGRPLSSGRSQSAGRPRSSSRPQSAGRPRSSGCPQSAGRSHSASVRLSHSPVKSPTLPSPKKSALKDLSKKSVRKTESIKFDLSNLENHHDDETFMDSEDVSEDDLTLHYSDSRQADSPPPSPRKSINSRSSRMLEKLGTMLTLSPSRSASVASVSSKKSLRGSLMVQKALSESEYGTDRSADATVASAFKTRTLSPRQNMESYSIVDLVSLDSNDLSKSVYDSADSTATYGTPQNVSGRKTRSTIDPSISGSSTPYLPRSRSSPTGGARGARRSRSSPARRSRPSPVGGAAASRRSRSLTTPENKRISMNDTKVPRASRSRSRINDSDLLLLDDTELEDSSPKTSRRTRTKSNAIDDSKRNDTSMKSPEKTGATTPENGRSPVEVGTPVLSIQRLLDSSRNSASPASARKGRKSVNYKRKTIGALPDSRKKSQPKSKSLGASARQTVLRLSEDSNSTVEGAPADEDTVTPRSAAKPAPEAVKNRHSKAKKPQSKRAIIDDLDHSDVVKQLFNSPVKRKLSQSMTEFSRKRLFDDEDEMIVKRPTRNTIAVGETRDDSVSLQSGELTPERFVSPLSTPRASPDLSGINRLFQVDTPDNDPRDVRGAGSLLRTHRTRRIKIKIMDVNAVKLVFDRSSGGRFSDVGSKEAFKNSPRVTRLSNTSKNVSPDVRGIKRLFRKSPKNDLSNVYGVKRTLRKSPKNDLTDVRGVRRMFGHGRKKADLPDLSGVEELYNTSHRSAHSVTNSEILFDQLLGKPPVKAVYSKTFSTVKKPKTQSKRNKSLRRSLDVITYNVEEWLEQELQKRFRRDETNATAKELQNLATSTVEGADPIRASRTRNSSIAKRSASEKYGAHTLPIKKRSLVGVAGGQLLPIKKRAVVHSTPVKGRVNIDASELGRVSPIAAADPARQDHSTSFTRTTLRCKSVAEEESPRPKVSTERETPSPSGTTAASPATPPPRSPPRRVTRNRKNTTRYIDKDTKKRRASLVVKKKRARASTDRKVITPKRTRVRKQAATTTVAARVVAKQSRKMKPETKTVKAEPKVPQPRRTRGKQTEPTAKETEAVVEKPRARRGAGEVEPSVAERGRGTKQTEEVKTRGKSVTKIASNPEETQPTRGNKNKARVESQDSTQSAPAPATRRRGGAAQNLSPPAPPAPAGRKKKTEETTVEPEKPERKTRGKKVEDIPVAIHETKTRKKMVVDELGVQPEPVARGRAGAAAAAPQVTGRKRTAPAGEEVPIKVARTRRGRGEPAAPAGEELPIKVARARRGRGEPAAPAGEELPIKVARARRGREEPAAPAVEEVPIKVARARRGRGEPAAPAVEEVPIKAARARRGRGEPAEAAGEEVPIKVARARRERGEPAALAGEEVPNKVARARRGRGEPAAPAVEEVPIKAARARRERGEPAALAGEEVPNKVARARRGRGEPAAPAVEEVPIKAARARRERGEPAALTGEEVPNKVARARRGRGEPAEAAGAASATGTRRRQQPEAPLTPKATGSKKKAQPKESPAVHRRQRKTKVASSPPAASSRARLPRR